MKNSKSIKGSGFFTFEEESTVEIFGKLKISKLGEIFLELMGNDAVPQTHPLFNFMEFPTNPPFRRPPIRSEAIVGEIRSKRGRNIAIRLESNRYFDPPALSNPPFVSRRVVNNPQSRNGLPFEILKKNTH